MVSMAFGIVGIIACLCCKDVEHKMTNTVCSRFILPFMWEISNVDLFLQIEVYLNNTSQGKRNKHK